jgi:RPA family protein
MSENESGSGTPGNREVAHRLFAAEYDDATYSYSESDEERAPNYVVTPTGARVNRLFAVGVLTEVGQAGETMLRARVADPTGAFVIYAGQYQPDAMAFLDNAEPPAFVAVTGKARTFQPEDSDQVFTSIRPEEINEIDSETRDRWTVTTAERTLERVATVTTALDTDQTGDELRDMLREMDVDPSFAAGIPIALDQYDTTRAYLADVQRLALDAIRIVADEIDAVDDLALAPDEGTGRGSIEPAIDRMSISTPHTTDTDTPDTSSTQERSATTTPSSSTPSTSSSPASTDEETTTAQRQESETETEPAPTDETTADQAEPTLTEHTQPESTQTESVEEASASTESSPEPSDEFDPEEFELDEEVRQEVESEYGTEFSTASEVDSPGEAEGEMNDSDVETSRETETDVETSFDDITDTDETTTQPTFDADTTAPETESESESESESELEPEEPEPAPEESPSVDEPATAADTTPTDTDISTETETNTETDADTESETAAEDVNLEAVLLETMDDLNDGDGADHETLVEQVSEKAGVSNGAVENEIQEALMSGQCYEPNDGKLKPI